MAPGVPVGLLELEHRRPSPRGHRSQPGVLSEAEPPELGFENGPSGVTVVLLWCQNPDGHAETRANQALGMVEAAGIEPASPSPADSSKPALDKGSSDARDT
jgi:hypothetical protein